MKEKFEPLIVDTNKLNENKKPAKDDNIIYGKGNFISKLFFSYVKKIISLANIRPIKEDDLGDLSEEDSAKYLSLLIKKDNIFSKSLVRILFGIHKCEFLSIIFISLITLFLNTRTIVAFRNIIIYFKKENNFERQEIINLSLQFIFFQFINIFFQKHLENKNNVIAIKITSQIKYLIFQKIFNLTKRTKIDNAKLINFMQNDSQKIILTVSTLSNLFFFPILISTYCSMLFYYMGKAFIFGFVALIVNFMFTFYLQNQMKNRQMLKQKSIDNRMKITTTLLNNIKNIKQINFETFFLNKILDSRNKELICYKNLFNIANIIRTFLWFSPNFISMVSIGAYIFYSGEMRVENIFTCLGIFTSLQDPIREFANSCTNIFASYASLTRIQNYLKEKEEIRNTKKTSEKLNDDNSKEIISIQNGNFGYSEGKFILKNINISINKNELVIIIGQIGSGKTTLFNALLNNIISSPESKINLDDSISYVSQSPFIKYDTVKNNILFFNSYNQEKYLNCIKLCELEKDIYTFNKGDNTLIGEKGSTLSGGQKSRIALARALYSDKDIYLFDDPFSSLDNDVGKMIFNNCILKELKDKTRIIITHSLDYLSHADRIIMLKNGEIVYNGDYNNLIQIEEFKDFKKYNEDKIKSEEKLIKQNKIKNNTNIPKVAPNPQKPNASVINFITKYIELLGGYTKLLPIIILLIIWLIFKGLSDFKLLEIGNNIIERRKNNKSFYYYIFYVVIASLFIYLRLMYITYRAIKGNELLHKNIISKIIKAPINLYHDITPRSNIINTLSKDLSIVDFFSSVMFGNVLSFDGIFILNFIITSYFQPICVLFIPLSLFFGIKLLHFYLKASRPLTLTEIKSNQPILTLLNEAYDGISTIKSFKVENFYIQEFFKKLDKFLLSNYFLKGSSTWFTLHLELFSLFFKSFLICLIIIFKNKFSPETIGLLLTYTIQLQETFMRFLISFSVFENSMMAFNRCLSYKNIISERPYKTELDKELTLWPQNSDIEFQNVSVKYRKDLNNSLSDITFKLNSNEKIGVCGRTGSGKSTLTLTLIRILELEKGKIIIDNVDISKIGLEKLRNSISYISQDVFIFEGTIKENVDPYNIHDNNEIEELLTKFNQFQNNNRFNLNFKISENGNNLSYGEKQIISIIRALIKKSKITILDEATSNIDYDIEKKIFDIIYDYKKDNTIITVSHRIKNFDNYNKILVIDDGKLVENDSPDIVLNNKDSIIYKLEKV